MRNLFFIALMFAVLVSFGACSQSEPVSQSADTGSVFESEYFSVTLSGTGPDVILMPGLASSGAVWDGTVAALQDRYTLHVIQVSGFAGAPPSGNADNDNILDDLAIDLTRYANTFETPPALVGHSLGGLVAMKSAHDASVNLSQLIIVDVLPFFSVLMDPEATAESIAPVSAMMKTAMLAQSDDVFARRQDEALRALVKDEANLQLAVNWSITSDRAVMAQAMSEVLVTDLRTDMSGILIPTTVIYAKDEAIPNMATIEAYYHDLYAPVPDVSLIAVEGALHFVMLDQPAAFLSAMETGLSR